MNYYGANEIAASFRTVRKNTLIIANEIPEDKYSYRPIEGSRSVAEILTHIAFGPSFQQDANLEGKLKTLEGYDFAKLMGEVAAKANQPRTKAEIIALLEEEGEKFAKQVESLSGEFLGETVLMPPGGTPPTRTRFEMLIGVKEHEMHHRGQLMLMERLIGVTPHLTRQREANVAAMRAAAEKKA